MAFVDPYVKAQQMEDRVEELEAKLAEARAEVERLRGTWGKIGIRCPQCGTPNYKLEQAEARLTRFEAWIAESPNQWVQRGDVRCVIADESPESE